jgi:glutaredoxin-related protein
MNCSLHVTKDVWQSNMLTQGTCTLSNWQSQPSSIIHGRCVGIKGKDIMKNIPTFKMTQNMFQNVERIKTCLNQMIFR